MCVAEFIRPVDEYRPLINGSIHALDTLIYICGEPRSAAAVATYSDPEKHECIAASIEFANGALATLASGYGTQTSAERLSVYGHGVAAWWSRSSVTVRRGETSESFEIGDSVRLEDRHFIDCVKGEAEPIATIDDAVVTMEWAHRILPQPVYTFRRPRAPVAATCNGARIAARTLWLMKSSVFPAGESWVPGRFLSKPWWSDGTKRGSRIAAAEDACES